MKFITTCESVFNEIQQLRRDLLSCKIAPDAYAMQMGGIAQLEKQQKLMLAGAIAERKLRKALPVALNRGTVEIEEERFECVDRNMVITRSSCLDFSGSSDNIDSCRSCKNYGTTRKLLIPQNEQGGAG